MEDKKLGTGWVILIIAIIVGFVYWLSGGIDRPPNLCQGDLDECSYAVTQCEAALDQANRSIDDANEQISTARDYAGASYEVMAGVLADLSEVQ